MQPGGPCWPVWGAGPLAVPWWRASLGAADRPPARSKGPVALVLNGTDAEFGEMAPSACPARAEVPQREGAVRQPAGLRHQALRPRHAAAWGTWPCPTPTRGSTTSWPRTTFAPHDPLIARDKYDLKQFYDLAVQALRIDGKLYAALQGQIARLFAFYNVDIFGEGGCGCPPPPGPTTT